MCMVRVLIHTFAYENSIFPALSFLQGLIQSKVSGCRCMDQLPGFYSVTLVYILIFVTVSGVLIITALQYVLKSGINDAPSLLLFKTTLAIQDLLCSQINFSIIFYGSEKNIIYILIGIALSLLTLISQHINMEDFPIISFLMLFSFHCRVLLHPKLYLFQII